MISLPSATRGGTIVGLLTGLEGILEFFSSASRQIFALVSEVLKLSADLFAGGGEVIQALPRLLLKQFLRFLARPGGKCQSQKYSCRKAGEAAAQHPIAIHVNLPLEF
jgi:hypothetical protein